jgi:aryl-alcohol dehydrogenase-like predicted oxidoreductase
MQSVKLGRNGPDVSQIGLGCMGMSEFYGPTDEAESLRVFDRALDLGLNFLDTADAYGPHTNEVLVGKALRGRRERVVLATKFSIMRDPNDPMKRGICGKPDYVKSCCDASLKRLGVDTIDLYYQHRVDVDTPIEETVGAMSELVQQGKVRYLGLSEAGPQTLRRACAVHPIAALQTEYSLWSRDPEHGILTTCRQLGIGFVAYSPLGRGILTGQIKRFEDLAEDDWRRHAPWFQPDNFKRNLELVSRLEALALEKNCTPAQLAIAWVLAQGEDIVPIPGTKRVKYLEDNIASAEVVLAADELAELNTAFSGAVAGTRYPEAMMKLVDM